MKKELPLISVLMPAYNAEKYIRESIQSILNQTYKNFELLILDDASTDSTFKIIKSFAKKDARISVYNNKSNRNIAASRNLLISKAKGKFIAWQDADDISEKNRLQLQLGYMLNHKKVGIIGGFLNVFDENGRQSIRKYSSEDKVLRKKMFMYSPVAQPTAMIRKEALDFAGEYGEDLSPAEDIDMSFRIGLKYEFSNIQSVTLNYRNYSNSATYKKLKKMELVTIKTRLKYIFNGRYNFGVIDLFFNMFHFFSIFLIPTKIKIYLFNLVRNS